MSEFDDLMPYVEAMKTEYLRHYPDKGDSWKTMPIEELKDLALKAIWEIITPEDIMVEWNPGQLVDIGNFLGMVWKRRSDCNGEYELENAKISDDSPPHNHSCSESAKNGTN